MPIHPAWNPQKGGSFRQAEIDLLKEIGERPGKGWSLHVMDHSKGLVPGNLCWAGFADQTHEQVRKIAARQRHEIKKLKGQVAELEWRLRKKIRFGNGSMK